MRIVAGGHPSGVLGDNLHGYEQTQSGMSFTSPRTEKLRFINSTVTTGSFTRFSSFSLCFTNAAIWLPVSYTHLMMKAEPTIPAEADWTKILWDRIIQN